MTPRSVFRTTCLFLLATLTLPAQEFRGTITGRISDPSGAGVPATVTVTNVATNEESRATAADSGDYTIPFLKPGKYTISVEAQGFKRATREDIEVRVDDRITVDFGLEVGAITENVTVTAAAHA